MAVYIYMNNDAVEAHALLHQDVHEEKWIK